MGDENWVMSDHFFKPNKALVTYVWCVMFDKNPKINETKIDVWCVMFDK